jgi:uncharacterized protein YecT (DUF1311 family)
MNLKASIIIYKLRHTGLAVKLIHIAGLVLLASTAIAQQGASDKISESELQSAIKNSSDCDELNQIHIDHLEYFDFNRDGSKEAVVVASTCMTGTAGPDIHAVYRRDAEGKVVEMPFHDQYADPTFGIKGSRLPVFGNPNYTLTAENSMLLASWMDGSDRRAPLVIWYKWNGKQFVVDHMKAEGPFATSYDCAKADREIDRAICYSPGVASLDVQLNKLYRDRLRQLLPDKRQALRQQQREWLLHRDKECVIYKAWVGCLIDLYSKRIAELKQAN